MLGETCEDYWYFLIADRIPCQPFVLMPSAIGSILADLSGEPSRKNPYEDVVRDVIPLEEQETHVRAVDVALEGERPETILTN